VNRQLIINPMETSTTLAPVTDKVRYMTTEALLDWLAETDHHEAPEIRAAFLWLVSSAARKAARTKISDRDARLLDLEKLLDEKEARIAQLEKVVGYTEQVKDRVSERDSVISQLQSDLATVLFDLNRAKRRASQLEEESDASPRKILRIV
jgi:predicted nuclease with TOPRIM domain